MSYAFMLTGKVVGVAAHQVKESHYISKHLECNINNVNPNLLSFLND